jgi:hypothetical protein
MKRTTARSLTCATGRFLADSIGSCSRGLSSVRFRGVVGVEPPTDGYWVPIDGYWVPTGGYWVSVGGYWIPIGTFGVREERARGTRCGAVRLRSLIGRAEASVIVPATKTKDAVKLATAQAYGKPHPHSNSNSNCTATATSSPADCVVRKPHSQVGETHRVSQASFRFAPEDSPARSLLTNTRPLRTLIRVWLPFRF